MQANLKEGLGNKLGYKLALLPLLCAYALHTHADVNINAGVSTEFVKQTVDDVDRAVTLDSDNIIVQPFLSLAYGARDIDAFISIEHNHVRRSLESEDVTNNFTDFRYRTQYRMLSNLLSLNVSGGQSYRSLRENSFLVDDFLFNEGNLSKNTTNRASLDFILPAGEIVGIRSSLAMNSLRSTPENPEVDPSFIGNLDSDTYSANVGFTSGRDLRPFLYRLDLQAAESKRERQSDFQTESVDLTLGTNIFSDFSIRLLGFVENNEVSDDNVGEEQSQILREFYSYGVGIAWQPSENRFIELGFNRSTTSSQSFTDEEPQPDEENDFLSLDMNWAFSGRTNLSANYARRFFGDSAQLDFSHSLRNWRSSITYREDVNTNSQLFLNQQPGVLVCANGSTDISDCSLSENINPDNLAPGDFLLPVVTSSLDLNDRVIIRKNWTAQTSFDRRRTTITASVTASDDEEVEIQRNANTLSGRLGAVVKISPRSSIKLNAQYFDVEQEFEGELSDSITKEFELEFERQFSRRLFASVGFRYLDRDGFIQNVFGGVGGGAQLFGINGPFTDRRISAEIRYEFDSSR
ncbi:hypothetical protein KJ365_07025 [Glaciecola sp. XM2]|uniref:hypothetical protein n=1 Tax=Glaciecola sp. XM2 TaxID=1914931 RepID=UPI001BDF0D7F|nr:hypothetical protein [Glaciecola sp. XM2]MBT1450632.1 hypothetical protein [Glaciecola sp. XM2]